VYDTLDIMTGSLAMNRLSRILASSLFACGVCAAPALAASADYYLKLEGVPGESEILGYGWGQAREVDGNGVSDALTDGLLLVRGAVPAKTRNSFPTLACPVLPWDAATGA
jgi:hypothetical protein